MLRRRRAGQDAPTEPSKFAELSSIFRIVTLYELLLFGEWSFVHQFRKKATRKELHNGMWFGIGFETVRLICVALIFTCALFFELVVTSKIPAGVPYQGTARISNMVVIFYITLSMILIIVIFFQFFVFYLKSAWKIAVFYAINFVLSFLFVTLFVFTYVNASSTSYIRNDVFYKHFQSNGTLSDVFYRHQRIEGCCGMHGPEDFKREQILSYTDAFTHEVHTIINDKSWIYRNSSVLWLPQQCCKKKFQNCGQYRVTNNTDRVLEIRKMVTEKNWNGLTVYQLVEPKPGTYYTQGCLDAFFPRNDLYVRLVAGTLIVFLIFTCLTTGFVIVLLLYQDGAGQLVSKDKIFDVSRNTGVHFLMSMDNKKQSEWDDDFSLLEFLKRTDIDEFIREPKPVLKSRMR